MEKEILQFLNRNNIGYLERGSDVANGNVNITCPFCVGVDWKSMGINLKNGYYGCWRSKQHRGRDVSRPLSAITGLDREYIRKVLKAGQAVSIESSVLDAVATGKFFSNSTNSHEEERDIGKGLALPKTFRRILKDGVSKKFFDYLRIVRGFGSETVSCIRKYNLKSCNIGIFKARIIIPVTLDGVLVGWTSRTIWKESSFRVLHLSAAKKMGNGEMPKALVNIKQDTVFNFDSASAGGRILVVTEGPFDSMKVDLFGSDKEVQSVAVYNTSCTRNQMYLLKELASKFDSVIVMFDPGFEVDSMSIASEIGSHCRFRETPSIFKGSDLGDLSKKAVSRLCSSLVQESFCAGKERRR